MIHKNNYNLLIIKYYNIYPFTNQINKIKYVKIKFI